MRICLSAGAYPTPEQPFAAFIEAIAKEFTKKGHDVVVIVPQSVTKVLFRKSRVLSYCTEYEFEKNKIWVYRPKTLTFGGKGILGKLTLRMNQWAVCRCYKNLRTQFDVIYAHFWTSAYNIMPIAMSFSIPLFVASGEDEIFITKLISRSEINNLKNLVKGVICVSTKNRNESIANNLTDKDKCIILPNGVNIKEFGKIDKLVARERLGFNPDDFIVAFVGRFVYRKGAKRVSDAINLIKDNSIKSIFIGSPTLDGNNDEIPNCSGILFQGKLNHSDIPLYLSSADVFVLPTLAEGCSNSIVEALACGLPIISSDEEFNYDILNKSNSVLINPLDINEISIAIKLLKDDSWRCLQMSKAAFNTAKKLDYSQRVDKILNFIKERK